MWFTLADAKLLVAKPFACRVSSLVHDSLSCSSAGFAFDSRSALLLTRVTLGNS